MCVKHILGSSLHHSNGLRMATWVNVESPFFVLSVRGKHTFLITVPARACVQTASSVKSTLFSPVLQFLFTASEIFALSTVKDHKSLNMSGHTRNENAPSYSLQVVTVIMFNS